MLNLYFMKIKRKLISKCKIVLSDDTEANDTSLSTFIGILIKLENDIRKPGFNKMDFTKDEIILIRTILEELAYETAGDEEPT